MCYGTRKRSCGICAPSLHRNVTLSPLQLGALGYHLLSRLAYVVYVGYALRSQERSGAFTGRWGAEQGFRRFRRIAAFIMNNDGVSFAILCIVTWDTLSLPPLRTALITAGALLMVLGGLTKFWAARTLGERAYYWHNFFTTERAPLNTRGPYRFLKNPMYTVGYLPLYGLALFTMSLPGLAAAVFDQAAILTFHRSVEKPHFDRWAGDADRVEVGTPSDQRSDTRAG
jgi:protein-S-isoprenylcysteine O-methyltransferase Ste14